MVQTKKIVVDKVSPPQYYVGLKEMRHIKMPEAAPKMAICHFQKLQMILK